MLVNKNMITLMYAIKRFFKDERVTFLSCADGAIAPDSKP